jgi:hypothetical protein
MTLDINKRKNLKMLYFENKHKLLMEKIESKMEI